MARYRLSGPARADLADILAASLERWGSQGRARYASLLAGAVRNIGANPQGPTTRDRADLLTGARSLHTGRVRGDHGVRHPVHVLFHRVAADRVIEVLRILHQRMDPAHHLEQEPPSPPPSKRRR